MVIQALLVKIMIIITMKIKIIINYFRDTPLFVHIKDLEEKLVAVDCLGSGILFVARQPNSFEMD